MRRRVLIAAVPAALAACATGGGAQPVRVVFFGDDRTELDAAAVTVVQDAAAAARAAPTATVRVLGFSAPEPAGQAVAGISAARAERVAAELERAGVPRSRIQVQGRGPVPFDAVPVESRRVEIRVGS
jgi:outer membrane protein OmpA-like peptidoglycan-associated protein